MHKQCVPGAPSDFSSACERGYILTNLLSTYIYMQKHLSFYLSIKINKHIPTLSMVSKTVPEAPAAVKRLSRLGPA